MGKSGIGVGSASIVLVFAVLCLTVFSLITFVVAGNEKSLVDARTEMVKGYYDADTLAELILMDILAANADIGGEIPGEIPDEIRGVAINKGTDEKSGKDTVYFFCDISESKALYVNVALGNDFFDILSWRMYDRSEWETDDSINVWTGE